jgi:8-oxo-dGTP diphosphatase
MNNPFSGKVRVRVNGLIFNEDSILLVNIQSPTNPEAFWMPPGGGVELGETLEQALNREILEETGLQVVQSKLWYITEYIKAPWHAIEFYFYCETSDFKFQLGSDPELDRQLLQDLRWFSIQELQSLTLKPSFLASSIQRDYPSLRNEPIFISSDV